jgi:hypothetical protein
MSLESEISELKGSVLLIPRYLMGLISLNGMCLGALDGGWVYMRE